MQTRISIHIILYMYVHVFKSQQNERELKQNYHFYVCNKKESKKREFLEQKMASEKQGSQVSEKKVTSK